MANITAEISQLLDKIKTFEQGMMQEVLRYLAPCKKNEAFN
jgi:hypothetical protein